MSFINVRDRDWGGDAATPGLPAFSFIENGGYAGLKMWLIWSGAPGRGCSDLYRFVILPKR